MFNSANAVMKSIWWIDSELKQKPFFRRNENAAAGAASEKEKDVLWPFSAWLN